MMQRLGYKNLFFDDVNLKTYTIQREASSIPVTTEGRAPGFHTNAVRDQMLTGFADMVRTNQIKIRSKRVIAELDTWIYKGPSARIDHQDGCHDDTLTCLAMGVFVMKFSMNKLIAAKNRDKALLKSWVAGVNVEEKKPINQQTQISVEPKRHAMPIYSNNTVKSTNPVFEAYKWLLR